MSDPVTASEKQAASSREPLEAPNSNANYAFLVHSQKTIPGNLPPNVDNKVLARQKRRRTSPEDHAILEAEYERNPKPDKAARVDIVSRVALGEKEVQIWFQNRRQNDRRKSRPLQPHEVFSPFRAYTHNSSTQSDERGESSQGSACDRSADGARPVSCGVSSSILSQPSSPLNAPIKSFPSTIDGAVADEHISKEPGASTTADASSQTITGDRPRPTSMKLSMSLDGNAQVTPNTNFQISPPKYRQNATAFNTGRVGGLKRSQSAIALGDPEPSVIPKLFSDFSRRSSIGRSRDSRTWEFYCDADSRDALTTQAEREHSGSAAGAISLIRSRSNSALHHNPNSRTLPIAKPETRKNPSSQSHRKSKLSRATSSLGRLQSSQGNIKIRSSNAAVKPSKLSKLETALRSPTGDSDKENWLPGTQISNAPRRQHLKVKSVKRPVLNENRQILSQSSGLEAFLAEDKRRSSRKNHMTAEEDKENAVEEDEDYEVGTFMKGSQRSTGGEDFDCVQGLLSLSQGAWR